MNLPHQDTTIGLAAGVRTSAAVDAWNDDPVVAAPPPPAFASPAMSPAASATTADATSLAARGPSLPAQSVPAHSAAAPAAVISEEGMLQSALTPLMLTTGIYLLLSAFGEVVWQMRVPELGNVQWRFVAIGVLAPNLLVISIGSIFITAAVMRASRRVWGWLWMFYTAISGLLMLILLPLFVLDLLQIRPILPASMSGQFLVMSAIKNIFAYAGAAVICFLCTLSTRRALRVERERAAASLRAWSA